MDILNLYSLVSTFTPRWNSLSHVARLEVFHMCAAFRVFDSQRKGAGFNHQ